MLQDITRKPSALSIIGEILYDKWLFLQQINGIKNIFFKMGRGLLYDKELKRDNNQMRPMGLCLDPDFWTSYKKKKKIENMGGIEHELVLNDN